MFLEKIRNYFLFRQIKKNFPIVMDNLLQIKESVSDTSFVPEDKLKVVDELIHEVDMCLLRCEQSQRLCDSKHWEEFKHMWTFTTYHQGVIVGLVEKLNT